MSPPFDTLRGGGFASLMDVDVSIPERYNASVLLDRNVEAGRADKTAILFRDERVSYGQLLQRACRFAGSLRERGLRREERVLLVLDDTPAFPVAFLGAIRAGCVPVPVNPLLKWEDHRFFLDDTYARAIVVDAEYREKLVRAIGNRADPPDVLVANGPDAGHDRFERVLESSPSMDVAADTHRDDMAFWLYSSGSTGNAKGVVHLQHDILCTCETYARHILGIRADDVTFSSSKLFHAYGLGNNLSFPFWAGATSVLLSERPTPAAVLETIHRHRPTLFFSVPTLYNAMLRVPDRAKFDLSSIRRCVSAAESLPPEVWRRWKEAFGHEILDGIGTTEMLHIFLSNRPGEVRPGSSGKPVPGYEAKVVDDDGRPLPAGRPGHLLVRGDSAAAYYWHQHERTKASILGAWMRTGDWYRVDGDGFYWYEGRVDDMMKVGGLWVSPIEIENALIEHPAVQEAAVVGVSVEGLSRMKAYVVLRPEASPSTALTEELQRWCKERLERYEYPHAVEFVSDLPKTITGKIQRFKLRGT